MAGETKWRKDGNRVVTVPAKNRRKTGKVKRKTEESRYEAAGRDKKSLSCRLISLLSRKEGIRKNERFTRSSLFALRFFRGACFPQPVNGENHWRVWEFLIPFPASLRPRGPGVALEGLRQKEKAPRMKHLSILGALGFVEIIL